MHQRNERDDPRRSDGNHTTGVVHYIVDKIYSRYGSALAIRAVKKFMTRGHDKDLTHAYTVGKEMRLALSHLHSIVCKDDMFNFAYSSRELQSMDQWEATYLSTLLTKYVNMSRFFTEINVWILYNAPCQVRKAYLRGYYAGHMRMSTETWSHGSSNSVQLSLDDTHTIYIMWIYARLSSLVNMDCECGVKYSMAATERHCVPHHQAYSLVLAKKEHHVMDPIHTFLHWLYGSISATMIDNVFDEEDRATRYMLLRYHAESC
jgi:hypothetical protein